MDVKISNIPPSTKIHLPRVRRVVCWKKNVHINQTPISDSSHVHDFFVFCLTLISSLVCPKPETPLENCWVLWFPLNYSGYSFGQLLVFRGWDFIVCVCVFFKFFAANEKRYGQKGGS